MHWVLPILQDRRSIGEYHQLVQELRVDDHLFQGYFRLTKEQFDNLLSWVRPQIAKRDTQMRASIGPAERLAICLRYLSTGNSFKVISYAYRVGRTTVANIVGEVCQAIWDCLVDEFMPVPTKEDWSAIADDFFHKWNFPNCLGSIDGKHVVIQAPSNSGSLYFNYKHTFSIVLLAIVDADYLFRVVDVGSYGRNSDGGTLNNSPFGEALKDGTLDLPEDCVNAGAEHRGRLPHVFVGDEAFPLRMNLLRPFPGSNLTVDKRAFNYRLSRAKLTVECAFGILSSQWRMYNPATRVGSNNACRATFRVRDTFSEYFNAEGSVYWQPQPQP
ncbi:uncharacterized protein LOC120557668 [Perca fluviatilis]|uniref:uncharacterized protein LOC120557668 n=1 Tax=Perca fluviatilis TaxID=8168 RepID=UPI00196283C2|nr:uncharacterized protein LOC120557668 [Perca fluviatilis]XP_039654149.1 uncharacterized protein LOC120557668 [Perca fluviatilis]